MTVTVTPEFHIVIPEEVRERFKVHPGFRFEVIEYKGRLELIPVGPMSNIKGLAEGMDPTIKRDDEDRI